MLTEPLCGSYSPPVCITLATRRILSITHKIMVNPMILHASTDPINSHRYKQGTGLTLRRVSKTIRPVTCAKIWGLTCGPGARRLSGDCCIVCEWRPFPRGCMA